MTPSLSPERPAHKDRSAAESVPLPGPELVAMLRDRLSAGGSGWWIGTAPAMGRVGVPRAPIGSVAEWFELSAVDPPLPEPAAVLPLNLAAAMVGGDPLDPTVYRTLGSRDRSAGRALYAAALRDLAALDLGETAAACGVDGDGAERQARRYVSRGRSLWRSLGGWPWCHLSEGWRQSGGEQWWTEPRVRCALDIWRGVVVTIDPL